jgi:eukaryotic-like serine/threonine-protein kinase
MTHPTRISNTQESWEEALSNFETAHDLLVSALGTADHPDVASSFNNMGLVLTHMDGRQDEALEKYRAASSAFAKSVGSEHPHVGSCRFNVGLLLQSRGSLDDATKEFEAAREIWEISLGPGHAHTEMARKSIEECSR